MSAFSPSSVVVRSVDGNTTQSTSLKRRKIAALPVGSYVVYRDRSAPQQWNAGVILSTGQSNTESIEVLPLKLVGSTSTLLDSFRSAPKRPWAHFHNSSYTFGVEGGKPPARNLSLFVTPGSAASGVFTAGTKQRGSDAGLGGSATSMPPSGSFYKQLEKKASNTQAALATTGSSGGPSAPPPQGATKKPQAPRAQQNNAKSGAKSNAPEAPQEPQGGKGKFTEEIDTALCSGETIRLVQCLEALRNNAQAVADAKALEEAAADRSAVKPDASLTQLLVPETDGANATLRVKPMEPKARMVQMLPDVVVFDAPSKSLTDRLHQQTIFIDVFMDVLLILVPHTTLSWVLPSSSMIGASSSSGPSGHRKSIASSRDAGMKRSSLATPNGAQHGHHLSISSSAHPAPTTPKGSTMLDKFSTVVKRVITEKSSDLVAQPSISLDVPRSESPTQGSQTPTPKSRQKPTGGTTPRTMPLRLPQSGGQNDKSPRESTLSPPPTQPSRSGRARERVANFTGQPSVALQPSTSGPSRESSKSPSSPAGVPQSKDFIAFDAAMFEILPSLIHTQQVASETAVEVFDCGPKFIADKGTLVIPRLTTRWLLEVQRKGRGKVSTPNVIVRNHDDVKSVLVSFFPADVSDNLLQDLSTQLATGWLSLGKFSFSMVQHHFLSPTAMQLSFEVKHIDPKELERQDHVVAMDAVPSISKNGIAHVLTAIAFRWSRAPFKPLCLPTASMSQFVNTKGTNSHQHHRGLTTVESSPTMTTSPITPRIASPLAIKPRLETLKVVELSFIKLDDSDLASPDVLFFESLRSALPWITALSLRGNFISDSSAIRLVELWQEDVERRRRQEKIAAARRRRSKRLSQRLSSFGASVSQSADEEPLADYVALERLDLSLNRIGDNAASLFAEALRDGNVAPHLHFLNLQGNSISKLIKDTVLECARVPHVMPAWTVARHKYCERQVKRRALVLAFALLSHRDKRSTRASLASIFGTSDPLHRNSSVKTSSALGSALKPPMQAFDFGRMSIVLPQMALEAPSVRQRTASVFIGEESFGGHSGRADSGNLMTEALPSNSRKSIISFIGFQETQEAEIWVPEPLSKEEADAIGRMGTSSDAFSSDSSDEDHHGNDPFSHVRRLSYHHSSSFARYQRERLGAAEKQKEMENRASLVQSVLQFFTMYDRRKPLELLF